ncbi:triose-phosphate transporter family-domain-containing protein [Trametes polyzona]|nr:triose-phosphate transporter family-domain-containing protein [Trametes polyzona]
MKLPFLSPHSPAELGVRQHHSGYFDLPAYGRTNLHAWNHGALSYATFGLSPQSGTESFGGAINLQSPSFSSDPCMDYPTLLQSRLGHSPRQRSVFPRDVTFTPAFDLASSPLPPQSAFPSPSLPVVAPEAPAAARLSPLRKAPYKSRVSVRSKMRSEALWLALYFAFNLGLTLYNKGVLVRFPYPYTLTAVHALCGSLGGHVLRQRKLYTPARLDARSYAVLAAFSVLYAVNIAVSNISLHLVTVPFHQVVRAATPIFTTLLSTLMLGTRLSSSRLIALTPVMLGVVFATYGDYYFTSLGLLLTLLGAILAAFKTIYTNILQSPPRSSITKLANKTTSYPSRANLIVPPPLNLHPLDLLTRMSPLAFVQCVAYAYISGEFARMRAPLHVNGSPSLGWWHVLLLLGNGCIAFGLNVVSFTANGKVGALNMTVAANVKQVLTIVLAVAVFDLTITRVNALGIVITLFGGAWYAAVEYRAKSQGRAERPLTTQ